MNGHGVRPADERAAALAGSLDTFTVGQILPLLAASRTTGTLRVRTEGDEGCVHCRDGAVIFASVGPECDFGNVLVRSGLLGADRWAELRAGADAAAAVEHILAGETADADRIHRLLVRHVEEAVFELDRWTSGQLHVEPGPPHPLSSHFVVPVDRLLLAVDERRDRWPALMARIGSEDRIVHQARIHVDDDGELRITRAQLGVLTQVDGTRSTRELARFLGAGLFRTCQIIAALAESGLVVLSADRSPGPGSAVAPERAPEAAPPPPVDPAGDAGSGTFEFVEPGPGPAQDLILRLLSAVKEEL